MLADEGEGGIGGEGLLEGDEDWSLLLSLPAQRIYYRQLMDVVLFRALLRAVQGRAVGWGRVGPRMFSPLPETPQTASGSPAPA